MVCPPYPSQSRRSAKSCYSVFNERRLSSAAEPASLSRINLLDVAPQRQHTWSRQSTIRLPLFEGFPATRRSAVVLMRLYRLKPCAALAARKPRPAFLQRVV